MFPATTPAKTVAVSVYMSPVLTPGHIAGAVAIDRDAGTSKVASAVRLVELFDPWIYAHDIVVILDPITELKRRKRNVFGGALRHQMCHRPVGFLRQNFACGVLQTIASLRAMKPLPTCSALRDRELAIFVLLENLPALGNIRRPCTVEIERVRAVTCQRDACCQSCHSQHLPCLHSRLHTCGKLAPLRYPD